MATKRSAAGTSTRRSPQRSRGHLVIIGGAEDRQGEKKILRRFVELCAGNKSAVVLLTAASSEPESVEEVYRGAFKDLGVKKLRPLHIETRSAANDPAIEAAVEGAGGIFMSGGNQKRLVAMVAGTRLSRAMHRAFAAGCCIAGTSAGASAMSEHMLSAVMEDDICEPGPAHLDLGLGFMRRATIDQHFSERDRLGRLLSVVATNPYLLGVGIDEDTALIVEPHTGAEVVGAGAVTLIDCRDIEARVMGKPSECAEPEISNVRLHRLPHGFSHSIAGRGVEEDGSLENVLRVLTSVNEAP